MIKRFTPILLSTFAFLLGWDLLTRLSGIPNFILPSPLSVWTRFLKAMNDGSLPHHTAITLTLPNRARWKRSFRRILWRVRRFPIVAIAPLLVIWLGDGILSKVVICALIVFFPVLVNTIVGVRAVQLRVI
jgi:NitT/TauT family transport system permease protein